MATAPAAPPAPKTRWRWRARDPPDLVLLDIGLPGMDGLDALRHFKETLPAPVIFVTARRRELDEVLGLELGADDYVTKPFDLDVLLARIKAVLRRAEKAASSPPTPGAVQVGDLVVDPSAHTVTIAGRLVELSPREFDLLHAFALQPGSVLSAEDLLAPRLGSRVHRSAASGLCAHPLAARKDRARPQPAQAHPDRARRRLQIYTGGGLMLRSLRSRLVLSHILPLVVVVPLMSLALAYLLETRFLLPKLAQDLLNDARLLTEIARTDYLIYWRTGQHPVSLFPHRAEPAGAPGLFAARWHAGLFQRPRFLSPRRSAHRYPRAGARPGRRRSGPHQLFPADRQQILHPRIGPGHHHRHTAGLASYG